MRKATRGVPHAGGGDSSAAEQAADVQMWWNFYGQTEMATLATSSVPHEQFPTPARGSCLAQCRDARGRRQQQRVGGGRWGRSCTGARPPRSALLRGRRQDAAPSATGGSLRGHRGERPGTATHGVDRKTGHDQARAVRPSRPERWRRPLPPRWPWRKPPRRHHPPALDRAVCSSVAKPGAALSVEHVHGPRQ